MLNKSYFDGTRYNAYMEILNKVKPVPGTLFEKIYGKSIQIFEDVLLIGRETVWDGTSFVKVNIRQLDAYKQYKIDNNKMVFEEKMLDITFQFKAVDYEKLVRYKDGLIYFFSNIVKEDRNEDVTIRVFNESFYFNRKEVARFGLIDGDLDYLRALDAFGTVKGPEKEAIPESVNAGQMKIATDMIKACQMLDATTGVKILVVGSASEGYGGGKSHHVMDAMFTNSTFVLYDPNEVETVYVTDRGNKFVRHAACFDYGSRDLMEYNLILDDAYMSSKFNRFSIDPERRLLRHNCYSCKCAPSDIPYFGSKAMVQRQVGKTVSGEMRVLSKTLVRQKDKDIRFGACQFCLDIAQFVINRKYDYEFFKRWKEMHPSHYSCGDKDQPMVRGGFVSTPIGDLYCEYDVPPTMCLEYDPISGCEKVNVVDADVGWYQFSKFEYVPLDLRRKGKFCIYFRAADCYLCSIPLGTIAPQKETNGMTRVGDVFFKSSDGIYIEDVSFKDPNVENVLADPSKADFYSKFNFYRSIVVQYEGGFIKSLPRVRYKRN